MADAESLAASNQSCSRAVRKRRLTNQRELSLSVDLQHFAPRHGRVARRSCLARRWWRHAQNARLASGLRRVMEMERHRHEALRTLGRKRRGGGLIAGGEDERLRCGWCAYGTHRRGERASRRCRRDGSDEALARSGGARAKCAGPQQARGPRKYWEFRGTTTGSDPQRRPGQASGGALLY